MNELDANTLAQFCGTESYTWGPFRKFVMTDGVTYLTRAGCAWFLDVVASYQTSELQASSSGFQEWKLSPNGDGAVVRCTDGNYNILAEQEIEFTDFPFDRFPSGMTVWLEHGSIDGRNLIWVAMLPQER